MQRCKYLDDLGLKPEQYGTNFTDSNDTRTNTWNNQRNQYGFDERETWNLDRTFVEWIYTRFMMYKEFSIIDTNYHKIPYKNKEITQGEAIDKILFLSKEILLSENYMEEENIEQIVYENLREICELFKELMPYMWW